MADEQPIPKKQSFIAVQWGKLYALAAGWVNSHGGPTKVGAAVIVLAGIAYGAVPPFHDFCVSVWMHVPTKVKTFFVTASALYAWLRNPATRKVFDALLGPGDKVKIENPILGSDGTVSAESATLTKAPETNT